MDNCLFCNIRDDKIPADFVYQDDTVMVFPDIHPIKPIHLLIVPKKHVKEFATVEDLELFKDLGRVIQRMIAEKGLTDIGYQIRINGGGAQDVHHLHMHLLGPIT